MSDQKIVAFDIQLTMSLMLDTIVRISTNELVVTIQVNYCSEELKEDFSREIRENFATLLGVELEEIEFRYTDSRGEDYSEMFFTIYVNESLLSSDIQSMITDK